MAKDEYEKHACEFKNEEECEEEMDGEVDFAESEREHYGED